MDIYMTIVFLLAAIILAALYFLSKGKYQEFILPVDHKRYPLKTLLPIGLYLLNAFKYDYTSQYDKRLLIKIIEISGIKYSQYYLKIHWANKIIYMILAALFCAFVFASAGPDPGIGAFCIMLMAAVVFLSDKELDSLIKKRRTSIQMDFPDFLNKLILLVNAGMTISRAWDKIASDNKKISPLYQELEEMLHSISSGKSEYQAYEDFAKRCRMPEITRFISVIIQNLKKGNSDMISILRLQANDCWEMRKNAAKKLGEEASTKMLLPMMIMFIAILIIVAVPAILAMRGI
jgi:tight adherence protein C